MSMLYLVLRTQNSLLCQRSDQDDGKHSLGVNGIGRHGRLIASAGHDLQTYIARFKDPSAVAVGVHLVEVTQSY